MYAVVESGGKQYRVEQGSVLVVDRLKAEAGDKVALKPVLFKDKEIVVDAKGLEKIKIEATVTEHLRGDKIKVFKYKPKKGYSRRAGHRAELTKLEVTSLGGGAKKAAPKKVAADKAEEKPKALRPRPAINPDNAFWFEAAREHRLVVQRCADCKSLRHPPGPCCPQCGSFAWDTVESSGRGHVYTFTVNHHPRHPAFDYPLVVAVIELAEGTRLIANMAGVEPADVEVGMPVVLDWIDPDPDLSLPVFRPAAHEER